MRAETDKPIAFRVPTKLELWLSVCVPWAMTFLIARWAQYQPTDRHLLADGSIEVWESRWVLISIIVWSLSAIAFGVAVLMRRRWRWLAIAGIMSLLTGGLFGMVMVSRIAQSRVMMITPSGITMSAPSWLGGETRARFDYSEIEWLGTRQRIRWKRDWRPINFIVGLVLGTEVGWEQIEDDEPLIKLRGGQEMKVDLGLTARGAWGEILTAAKDAGVTVKPVERIVEPKPTD